MSRVGAVALVLSVACSSAGGEPSSRRPAAERESPQASPTVDLGPRYSSTIARACALPDEQLARIWRGFDPLRSEDLTFVPNEPNVWGRYSSHSGPWDYVQEIPLVFYGPKRIAAQGPVSEPATLADVYPTVGALLGEDLKEREGKVLASALKPNVSGAPKLIVSIVWDAAGNNVLARHPDSWPTLARLMEQGTYFENMTVGSSPSITPATHATFGTGTFPRVHGVVGIQRRDDDGERTTAFKGGDPSGLRVKTFADQFDKRRDNIPKVGLLGSREWHMPMMGQGAMVRGGDRDELALMKEDGRVIGSPRWYRTPRYLTTMLDRFEAHVAAEDRSDGRVDDRSEGHEHDILDWEDSPAWVAYESDLMMRMLRRGGYGTNRVPDLFFANFKATDLSGHVHTMDSVAMERALRAQDRALRRLVRYLDRNVGDHVVILTADHASTPELSHTGGWGIYVDEFRADVDRALGIPKGVSAVDRTTAYGTFFDRNVLRAYGATVRDAARFLLRYTIADNLPKGERIPKALQARSDEPILAAAWAKRDLPAILECAFGPTRRPPPPP